VARRAGDPGLAGLVPPGLFRGLLAYAGEVLGVAWRSTGDHRLLDEALAVLRRAVESEPGGGLAAVMRLSLCDLRATEQQISLPTAFLRAGAAHVLATLWLAPTEMSRRFSIVFYRRLADGLRPADAFRHAAQHVRDDWFDRAGEELPAYYWAQYTHFCSPW